MPRALFGMVAIEPIALRADAPDGAGHQGVFRKCVGKPLCSVVVGARYKAEKSVVAWLRHKRLGRIAREAQTYGQLVIAQLRRRRQLAFECALHAGELLLLLLQQGLAPFELTL